MAQLVLLKIKDHVQQLMRSQPLELLKELLLYPLEGRWSTLFNSLLIVHNLMAIVDVIGVKWINASTISKIMVKYYMDVGLRTWGSYPYNAYVGPCRMSSG